MSQSANTAALSSFYTDMFHSSTAQVTMSSWLPCLPELLSWIPLFFLSLVINLAHNLKQVSISLLSRSWIWIKSSSCKIRLTLSSRTQLVALGNKTTSKSSLKEQSPRALRSSLFQPNFNTTSKLWWTICAESLCQSETLCHPLKWSSSGLSMLTIQELRPPTWRVESQVEPSSRECSRLETKSP